ncbi:unnamed protein product [Cylicocyclus nassatus]|uniref:Uncharacterized protein n=1 Tax=Cylicocyclus nassatus TaxID=53992 RepID=A0AA36GJ42_CYLNA|nr:unnamed protein product [Cylicocyclus nassatus]
MNHSLQRITAHKRESHSPQIKMKIFLVAVLALPCAFAVRCYYYIDRSDDLNPVKSWMDCDDSKYCFKTYIEQHETLNDKKWIVSRSCGSSNVCKSEGCTGTRNSWSCCCRGELCNLTPSKKIYLLTIFSALYIMFAL